MLGQGTPPRVMEVRTFSDKSLESSVAHWTSFWTPSALPKRLEVKTRSERYLF